MKLVKCVYRKGQAGKNLAGIFQVTCILIVFLGKVPQSPLIIAAYSLEKTIVLIFMAITELTLLFVA